MRWGKGIADSRRDGRWHVAPEFELMDTIRLIPIEEWLILDTLRTLDAFQPHSPKLRLLKSVGKGPAYLVVTILVFPKWR
jgi:hypothetical protein